MEATVAALQRSTKISNRTTRLRKFWFAMASGAVILVFLQHSHYTLASWKMESSTPTSSISDAGDTRSTTDSQALMCFRIGANWPQSDKQVDASPSNGFPETVVSFNSERSSKAH